MYEFLDRIQFFKPSSELTNKIVELRHMIDVSKSYDDRYNAEEVFRESSRYGRETEQDRYASDRLKSFLSHLEKELLPQKLPYSEQELERIQHQNQLIIAERLYGFLAILARRPRSLEGYRYNIRQIIPEGMGILLGFSQPQLTEEFWNERESPEGLSQSHGLFAKLLQGLTSEFERWLTHERGGQYVAPWGEMLIEGEDLLLIAHTFAKLEPNRQYTRAKYTPAPSEVYYNRKTRKA